MTTTNQRSATEHYSRRILGGLAVISLVSYLPGLGGCSYLESITERTAPRDDRIQLGWRAREVLHAREIPRYTCEGQQVLLCEQVVWKTYSCSCASP